MKTWFLVLLTPQNIFVSDLVLLFGILLKFSFFSWRALQHFCSYTCLWCLRWLGWWCRTLETGIFSNKVLEINESKWRCHLVCREGKPTSLWSSQWWVEKSPAVAKWMAESSQCLVEGFIDESNLGGHTSSTDVNNWSCMEITDVRKTSYWTVHQRTVKEL